MISAVHFLCLHTGVLKSLYCIILYIFMNQIEEKNPDKEIKIMSVTMKQFTTIYGNESTLYGNLASLDSNRKCLLEDTGHLHVRSIYSLWRQLQIKTRVPLTISVSFLRYLSNIEWCFHSWLPNLLLTCLIRSAHTVMKRTSVFFWSCVEF